MRALPRNSRKISTPSRRRVCSSIRRPRRYRSNISLVQTTQEWSSRVVDHLMTTLHTVSRLADVDEKDHAAVETASPPS
jgi:hypothetical protein